MRFTEEQLKKFAEPLSMTEKERCKNAIKMLRDALDDNGYLSKSEITLEYEDTLSYTTRLRSNNHEIKLLVQGSYANNTNVKTESDVDVAIIQEDVFQTSYRDDQNKLNYGFKTSDYTYYKFKNYIYESLVSKFGIENVIKKNKCILVKGNSYRVDADSVPARRYRDYREDYQNNPNNYKPGIYIKADDGQEIINYPEQHIENGRKKNNDTNYFYKKMVRIIKKIRYLMIDDNIESAKNINSFKLECLLWNISDGLYLKEGSYVDKFQGLVDYILCKGFSEFEFYKEVNGIKQLFNNDKEMNNLKMFMSDLNSYLQT